MRQQANYNYNLNPNDPLDFWLNPYFSFDTTNEVDFARTLPATCPPDSPPPCGTGQQLFDVDTGLNVPGPRVRADHPGSLGDRQRGPAVLVGRRAPG